MSRGLLGGAGGAREVIGGVDGEGADRMGREPLTARSISGVSVPEVGDEDIFMAEGGGEGGRDRTLRTCRSFRHSHSHSRSLWGG